MVLWFSVFGWCSLNTAVMLLSHCHRLYPHPVVLHVDCAGQFCVLSDRCFFYLLIFSDDIQVYQIFSVNSRKMFISKYKPSISLSYVLLIASSRLQNTLLFTFCCDHWVFCSAGRMAQLQMCPTTCLWQHSQRGAYETDFTPSLLTLGYYSPSGLGILSFATCVSLLLKL